MKVSIFSTSLLAFAHFCLIIAILTGVDGLLWSYMYRKKSLKLLYLIYIKE